MGKISTILYEKADNYTAADCTKDFWFQNMLDTKSFDEFEEYKIKQRKCRDALIKRNMNDNLNIKTDTSILASSLNGVVLIAECEKI